MPVQYQYDHYKKRVVVKMMLKFQFRVIVCCQVMLFQSKAGLFDYFLIQSTHALIFYE